MIKQMTDTDIIRLGKTVGIDLSTEEAASVEAHIQKQLHSFSALESVNTNDIEPTFDLACEGRFMVSRCGE